MVFGKFSIIEANKNDLDLVRSLWVKLNQHHLNLSPNFKDRFKQKNWIARKKELLEKSADIQFNYAIENETNRIIAYCISTVSKEDKRTGEIDSIYIEESYRKYGIGKELMNLAIKWLVDKGTVSQRLLVGVGNEDVIDYYKQFDFFPLHIVLQRISKNHIS